MRNTTVSHEPVTITTWKIRQTTTTCDKCGHVINPADTTGVDYANQVTLYLNPDECVSCWHRRDYCPDCLPAIWDAMCAIIGADPQDHSHKDFEND